MRRFGRFIILALIGFAVGAGLAYFQGMQEAKKLAASNAPVVAETPAPEASKPAVEASDTASAVVVPTEAEVKNSDVLAKTDTAEVPAADAALQEATPVPAVQETQPTASPETQAVAGSTVGGAFSLTDQNGVAVTEKSWPGKYKMVFFGFTHCPDICPTTLDKLTGVLTALGADADKIQTLFITTDPARDTAETMKTFVGGYHATILGLTGTEEQVKAAEDTYKVYAAKVPGADAATYSMDHSSYVFLMSPDDKMLEIFKNDDVATDIVAKIQGHLTVAQTQVPAP